MLKFLIRIGDDNSGATAVEYGLIVALLFLAIVGGVQAVGQETIEMWTKVSTTVDAAIK